MAGHEQMGFSAGARLASADVVHGSRKYGPLRRGVAVETATVLIS